MAQKPVTKKTPLHSLIATRARKVLEVAEEYAKQKPTITDFHDYLFGVRAKATRSFTTESERTAFSRTQEYTRLLQLFDDLPAPPVQHLGRIRTETDGIVRLALPRSVHAVLLAEANAEGVSLEHLCLSKLLAQLRAVV